MQIARLAECTHCEVDDSSIGACESKSDVDGSLSLRDHVYVLDERTIFAL